MSTTRKDYQKERMTWHETKDPEYPFSARINQDNYLIRLNDFPDESLYTLFVNNEEIGDLEDWPERWIISGNVKAQESARTERVRKGIQNEPRPDLVRGFMRRPRRGSSTELVRRIIAGDAEAEEEIFLRFKVGISIIIGNILRSDFSVEGATQDTFRIALEKIRQGGVPDSARLFGFLCAIARNVARERVRQSSRKPKQEEITEAERIADPRPSPLDQVLQGEEEDEKAKIFNQVVIESRTERDRYVLLHYYIAEEDARQICTDLGLAKKDFNEIVSRARRRFKELYLANHGETD